MATITLDDELIKQIIVVCHCQNAQDEILGYDSDPMGLWGDE